MAIISVLLVIIHKLIEENVYGEGRLTQVGDIALVIFSVVVVLALVFMADTFVNKIKPLFVLRKFIEKFKVAKYEFQVLLHNLSIIALIILLIHVLQTTSSMMSLVVKSVFIIYFAIAACFYLYHRYIKRLILNKNKLIVSEVIKESPNMYTLKLVPDKGQIFNYKPGQFGFLRLLGKNIGSEEHPFSISSEPTNKKFIAVTIKFLGDFTSKIKNVEIGTKATLDGPYGKLCYLNYPHQDGVVFIAGGVGITPVLSMLRYMHAQEKEQKVIVLWGINTRNDLICREELELMQKEMNNFKFIPVAFKDDSWEGEKGLIDRERIETTLRKNEISIDSQAFFVCGPSQMLGSIIKSLKSLGVKKEKIHFEKFSL